MKGVYVLVISVEKDAEMKVGSLGRVLFTKGKYAYVGSAQSGIESRVRRHMSSKKKSFWHIDYLLGGVGKVTDVFYSSAKKSRECEIAKSLGKSCVKIERFGCSDCRCDSHLFKIGSMDSVMRLGLRQL